MRGLGLVLLWAGVADAFQTPMSIQAGTAVRPARTRMPVAQFDFFGGNKKKKTASSSSSEAADAMIPFKDPATLTPEEGRRPSLDTND